MKQERNLKKKFESSLTQHELQKVIKEATTETLDSSQKLQMKDLRRLNQPD